MCPNVLSSLLPKLRAFLENPQSLSANGSGKELSIFGVLATTVDWIPPNYVLLLSSPTPEDGLQIDVLILSD
jgi:hypothetical protein